MRKGRRERTHTHKKRRRHKANIKKGLYFCSNVCEAAISTHTVAGSFVCVFNITQRYTCDMAPVILLLGPTLDVFVSGAGIDC